MRQEFYSVFGLVSPSGPPAMRALSTNGRRFVAHSRRDDNAARLRQFRLPVPDTLVLLRGVADGPESKCMLRVDRAEVKESALPARRAKPR